jgi:4-oxalocrotonate tautomerase
MPLVTVTLRKGRPHSFLRKVGNAIHQALVNQAKIPEADRFHVFHEVGAYHMDVNPSFAGAKPVERSSDVLIIEITLNAGRSDEVKAALYAEIASRLHAEAKVRPDDVFVILTEVMKQNWSMASGLMTYPA